MRNQATPSPSRASIASMNQGRPCAARRVRTGNRVGSAASPAGSIKAEISTARSRDNVTRTAAQGWSSSAGHNVLSITLMRPPSLTTASSVRNSVIGVGRRNHADDAIAVPQLRSSASASISAVSKLATAPPCRPAKGPAASGVGCQRWGPIGSKMAKVRYPAMRNVERRINLAEALTSSKRDFLTSDEYYSSIGYPALAAARDPAHDRATGVRARRFATELSPRGARPVAQPVRDQPSDPWTGRAVRHQTVRAGRAFGAADGGW